MKSIMKIVIILAGISLVIIGCTQKNSSEENELRYELINLEKQSDGCDSLREDNCAKIKFEFPQIVEYKNSAIKEKINTSIKSLFSMNNSVDPDSINFDNEMNAFINDYESYLSEFPDAAQNWFIERTGEAKLNKANIFSIDYTDYSYTGGAHPNTFVGFRNYNIANGEEITLDEIIVQNKQTELTKVGEEEFRKLKGLSAAADLGEAGFWFENNKFYLNDNFLITDSTLVFYYNNYEITAYAYGPTELIIPYTKIKSLIDDKSLIKPLVE